MAITTTRTLIGIDVAYENGAVSKMAVAYSYHFDDPNDAELPVDVIKWKEIYSDTDVTSEHADVIAMHNYLYSE